MLAPFNCFDCSIETSLSQKPETLHFKDSLFKSTPIRANATKQPLSELVSIPHFKYLPSGEYADKFSSYDRCGFEIFIELIASARDYLSFIIACTELKSPPF